MSAPYVRIYNDLTGTLLSSEARERTAGFYWYTVTNGATAHTAFRTREELLDWADKRGLTFPEGVPEPNPAAEYGTPVAIVGGYCTASHRDVAAFDDLAADMLTPVLDNGGYTLGKVTIEDGTHTVHFLNVNDRGSVFPWGRDTDQTTVLEYIDSL